MTDGGQTDGPPSREGGHAGGHGRRRLPALDGLRALAVSWVIVMHAGYVVPYASWFQPFASRGVHGVRVFFVLSGFLITWLLLEEEQRQGGARFSLGHFYVRRGFRILPPVFVFLAGLALLSGFIEAGIRPVDWLGCLFFFRNLIDGSYYTAHFWSLAIEEQFYLFWPLVLALAPARWRLGVTAGLCAFAPFWRQINMELVGGQNLNWSRADLNYDMLLTGALLAQLQRQPWFRRILAGGEPTAYGALAAGGGMIIMSLALELPKYLEPGRLPLELAGIAVVMKVLVEGRARAVQVVLGWGPVEFLGRVSYSLYLWQQIFFPKKPLQAWQYLPWNLVLALAAAAASYYLIEQPALGWRERFLRRNQKCAPSDKPA